MRCDLEAIELDQATCKTLHRCKRCKRECRVREPDPSRVKMTCGVNVVCVPPPPPLGYGPGTELKAILVELGLTDNIGCGCEAKANEIEKRDGVAPHIIGWDDSFTGKNRGG